MRPRRTRPGYVLLVGAVLAAIVHLATVLAVASVGERSAYARIVADTPLHTAALVAKARAGSAPLPFHDPATAVAACPFDLGEAPVRVRASVGDLLLTLSFHAPDGRAFYGLSDKAAQGGALEAVLMTRGQLDEAIRNDDEEEPSGDVRVLAPAARGLAVVRVLTPFPSDRAAGDALAARLTCQPDPAAIGG